MGKHCNSVIIKCIQEILSISVNKNGRSSTEFCSNNFVGDEKYYYIQNECKRISIH